MSGDGEQLHWFRRLLLLLLGGGLLGGGFTYAALIVRGAPMLSSWFALGAGFMVALGGFILWADIVGPTARALRRRFRPPPPRSVRPPSRGPSRRGGGRIR